jgi:NDP-sugar pyrophosphorylase family protein
MPKRAFIVSGGFGTRLRPYTSVIPKPLLPVGTETLLERQIGSLLAAGVQDITVALHYLPHLFEGVIEAFSRRRGISIKLAFESSPLGTFGSVFETCRELHQKGDNRPLLVLNADIVSDIDLAQFHAFGESGSYDMAVAVNNYLCEVPYGVICAEDDKVKHIEEKPCLTFPILAGVYFVRPSLTSKCDHLNGKPIGVDEVMRSLIDGGTPIGVYRHYGEWIDAGTLEDLEKAARIQANT